MRLAIVFFLLFTTLFAQDPLPLRRGAKEYTVLVGGGSGTGKRTNTQMLYAGGRFGYVLTKDLFRGPLRGNLETVIDVLPLFIVFQPQTAIGASFNPGTLKWNFTSGKKIIPFMEIGGGVLVTNHDVPANTNHVNFTPQGGFGIHFLRPDKHGRKDRAVTFTAKYMHISNAGLDRRNAGINASVQFVLGYTWFK